MNSVDLPEVCRLEGVSRTYAAFRNSNPACELDACLRDKVKLRRAYGGCLGSQRRRRTWTAAISFGELLTSFDPEISEWGNPQGVLPSTCDEFIVARSQPRELKHLST
jgi:hypothetical protein